MAKRLLTCKNTEPLGCVPERRDEGESQLATGTGGFAGLLTAMKDRSGLSYGALARQLHMSASTLHRYCTGEAVPADYAPVERLARLCGADADELVELHRQWILADESRRRAKAGGPDAVRAPAPVAVPAPAAPTAPVAPVPPATTAAPDGGQAPAPDRAEDPDPAPDPHTDPAPAPAPAAEERHRRRTRRVRAGLALAALVAVAVPGALAVNRLGGDGAGPDAKGGGQELTGGTAPEDDGAGVAPRVGLSSYNWEHPCFEEYLLDKGPAQVPPPPPPQDDRSWSLALGGVPALGQYLQLTATGVTDSSVVLTGLDVRVVRRGAPQLKHSYSMGEGCGGGLTPQVFDIDLDAPQPRSRPVAGHQGDVVVPAKDFPYKVSTHDPQVLNLFVHTEDNDVEFYLEAAWSSGDRHGRIRIGDGQKPFRISATKNATRYVYWPEKQAWYTR
ncbi:helix-turn-helix transcriptional regulator [Streptomyces sp. NPDC089919]|uniref:helix-turn-helix domain-containing protein n=1 Tax=Streptomyces sp. NPDC089919 TaxID=3155188 RepID=UPI00343089C5